MNYETASAKLGNRQSKKLQNNTYLQRRDATTVAVMLHSTDVVTFKANGEIILNSGTWRTVTTKDRINTYVSGIRVSSVRGIWQVVRVPIDRWSGDAVLFADGMVIPPNGPIEGMSPDAIKDTERKLNKAISSYIKAFAKEVVTNGMDAPSAGDCLFCQLDRQHHDNAMGLDHILSHICLGNEADETFYLVPSLLWKALTMQGRNVHFIWSVYVSKEASNHMRHAGMVTDALRYYFRKQRQGLIDILEGAKV